MGKRIKQVAWDIYLFGKKIDTIFCDSDCDETYVRCSLIDHDGYNQMIQIRRRK